jgi:type II secretory pathway component HofQ
MIRVVGVAIVAVVAGTVSEARDNLNPAPRQLEIVVQFIEYNLADIDKLSKRGPLTQDELLKLRETGNTKLLAAPRIVTESGMEATVKGVVEHIYPTEYDLQDVTAGDTNQLEVIGTLVNPYEFETREVGELLTVLPEVSPDGATITVTMMPQIVFAPTWKDYGNRVLTMRSDLQSGKSQKMEQPFFPCFTLQTSVTVRNGATVLLGGCGRSNEHPEKVIYAFVTARLVGVDGKPLKKP